MALRIIFSFILSIALTLCTAMPMFAQSADAGTEILTTTFNQMPPFDQDGFVLDIPEDVGYSTGREWVAGELPADVVKLGDVETGLGAEQLSLQQIAELTGIDLSQLNIASLEFLQGVTVEEFLKDVPFLGEWKASDIPELAELSVLGSVFTGDQTLSEVIAQAPEIAGLEITEVFGELPISSIPNLEVAQLADFAGIGDKVISAVPGLGDVSLESFPIPVVLPSLNVFPKQDIAFGPKEYSGEKLTPKPVSGGTNGKKTWEPIACSGGCAHIELYDNGWKGDQWMTKAHRVKDGYGLLGGIFGEAGAYRLPFGQAFALQITNTDEKTGTAEWGLAFRVCSSGLVDLGCTAYFMEIPLGVETKEGDNVLAGLKDGQGGASQPMDAPPGWEALRPDAPPELQGIVAANTPAQRSGGASLCGDGPGGVKLEALAEAFNKIESEGSGDYGAVGIWVSLTPGETGRALGKYQYMSYKEVVVEELSSRPGGAELLRKAKANEPFSQDEMLAVFPPDLQEAIFIQDQQNTIEDLVERGYEGDRLLEVLGQVHIRGPGVLTNGQLDSTSAKDGLGTSVKGYGDRFRNYYREAEKKLPEGDADSRCGKVTGKYRNPTEKGWKPHEFFNPTNAYNKSNGMTRKHLGVDLGGASGESVVAADGGAVTDSGFQMNKQSGRGWGNYIVVDHGDQETLYAHLSSIDVARGDKVQKGQHIGKLGSTGGSSGPHLHFEVIIKGQGNIDPMTVTNFDEF